MPSDASHLQPQTLTPATSAPQTTGIAPVVVFDLDGTLVDTADDLVATVNALLARDHLRPIAQDELKRMVGAGARTLLQRAYGAHGVTLAPARLEDLFHAFLEHYEQNICVHSRPYAGVEDSLARFADAGWRLAVCTNKMERASVTLLEALGLKQRMDFICGQDSFAYCKPDPRTLLDTIAACHGQPARSVMVGDSRTDIDTAKAAGVGMVAVTYGYTDVDVRSLGPNRVIDHFGQLWDAATGLLAP